MRILSRLGAIIGIAGAQLRSQRLRTILAIVGICLAVLSMTLLASLGVGVVETGQQKFDSSGRDLWVTGGPVRLSPGAGGLDSPLDDAHSVTAKLDAHEDVRAAAPMAFQTVYVSDTPNDFQTIIGVGAPTGGSAVTISSGRKLTPGDPHYAGGDYDGPMTHEVVISPEVAERMDVEVNDTLYIGSSLATARQNKFTVVGISSTFSTFLGSSNVVMHLSELQEVSGTAGTDTASIITIKLVDGGNPQEVATELEAAYPQLDFRTNQEQLQSTLRQQAVVIAAGACLVLLALVSGVALTMNLLLSLVYQQRKEFAALRAQGLSVTTLVGIVTTQSLVYGVTGGVAAAGLTYPLADVMNVVIERVVGFENVIAVDQRIVLVGFGLAVVIGVLGAVTASWRLSQQPVTELLDE
ncbi:ABC transporter permease [Haloferax larsenii]|uniref:ABC-type transport system, involved in lipoprotein release, permease component n=1 Tax=Haloferax larsenii TaxID=302484 RepID=A0A1H7VDJ3_HALLR|nr:ABC transporter permease [Haloferax larsenii]SEM06949.1 ABC-type transport system, involved in lipoprotein release, permease component [Haloferax larsenii]